jgi:hypothetical protein
MGVPWSVYTSTCSHCLCTPLASWRDPDRATLVTAHSSASAVFCTHTRKGRLTHRSQAESRRLRVRLEIQKSKISHSTERNAMCRHGP